MFNILCQIIVVFLIRLNILDVHVLDTGSLKEFRICGEHFSDDSFSRHGYLIRWSLKTLCTRKCQICHKPIILFHIYSSSIQNVNNFSIYYILL